MKRMLQAIALGVSLALVVGAAAFAAHRTRASQPAHGPKAGSQDTSRHTATRPVRHSQVARSGGRRGARKPERRCPDNLRQLGSAMRMYLQDWDDRLPAADCWSSGLSAYAKKPDVWYCPLRAPQTHSYALNRRLAGLSIRDEQIWGCVLLFESSTARKNAADEGQSLLSPGLHDGGNYFLFADGRVEWRKGRPSF